MIEVPCEQFILAELGLRDRRFAECDISPIHKNPTDSMFSPPQDRLHYGPIVRTGPNELAVIDKELIPHILGAHGMPKGPIWDGRKFGRKGGKEYDSLIESRVQEEHTLLRKPWNKAFSAGPVKGYERLLMKRVEQLVRGLENVCLSSVDGVGKVNMAEWVSFLAFDFMGDLAFGGAFDTLATGDPARYIQGMYKSMILPNITQHIPWSLSFLRTIPNVDAGMTNMMLFAQAQVKKRLKQTPNYPDLFHYLIEATEETDFGVDPEALMVQNSILAIIAGSDTTASVLSNAFYYLMLHPQYLMRLQAEINGAYAGSDFIDADSLTNLNYLNAVINETLRLQPAVPTYLNRAPTRGSGGKPLLVVIRALILDFLKIGSSLKALLSSSHLMLCIEIQDTFLLDPTTFGLTVGSIVLAKDLQRLQEKNHGSDFIDADSLTNLNYLNAVINETLRLQPAVPTYLNRAPTRGSGGKSLGKSMFIPEGTSIVVSPYAMHRDPRYFSPRPNDFWPDRWLHSPNEGSSTASREEPFILSRDAFIPFSTGPANCAGKPLALIELRLVIANVVRRFEIAFDDGYDPRQWERELRDRFVMVKGELKTALKLQKISGVQS
ncbi:Cytochrome P450 67 [Leucoagaricus sp. SymC.cos]|nr:Cytochrome P450 67 [Leucoagaricus sp. SymC.cos]